MSNAALPPFARVIVCTVEVLFGVILVKLSTVGVKETFGAGAAFAVAVIAKVCGELGALSAIVRAVE
ncbi:MAG: hypothetical protein WB439_04310 [Acidobacteriaceae bacterium]